jgi:hypothetical protein
MIGEICDPISDGGSLGAARFAIVLVGDHCELLTASAYHHCLAVIERYSTNDVGIGHDPNRPVLVSNEVEQRIRRALRCSRFG